MAAKPQMSDKELARRKRAQARFSITGSTLGLAALGLKGGATAARLAPKAERLVVAIPALKKIPADVPKRLSDAATTSAIGAAGVGGVGGYNFASYTKEDARRNHYNRKVRKAMAGDSEGTETSFRLVKVPENKRTATRLGRTAAGAGIGAALGSGHGTKAIVGGSLLGAGVGAFERVPKYKLKPTDKKKSKKISKRIEIGIYKGYDPEERRKGKNIGGFGTKDPSKLTRDEAETAKKINTFGIGGNITAAAAGANALYLASKNPNLPIPKKLKRITAERAAARAANPKPSRAAVAGAKTLESAKKVPVLRTFLNNPKKVAAASAVGWLGLHAQGSASDVVANRALVRERNQLRARLAQGNKSVKKPTVSKRIEMGIYKGYDPEERRQRMSGAASGAGAVGAGGLGYMAYKQGVAAKNTVDAGLAANKESYNNIIRTTRQRGQTLRRATKKNIKTLKEVNANTKNAKLVAIRQGKKAAILGAGALASGAASAGLAIHANKRGRTYQTWY